MGYGLTKEDVQRLAFSLVEKMGLKHPFTNGMAGCGWFDGFKARHPVDFTNPAVTIICKSCMCKQINNIRFFCKAWWIIWKAQFN